MLAYGYGEEIAMLFESYVMWKSEEDSKNSADILTDWHDSPRVE